MTLISLVGEQPLPNLLPALHLRPERLVLVCTTKTKERAERLKHFFAEKQKQPDAGLHIDVEIIQVDSYNIGMISDELRPKLQKYPDVALNLTGGTKPMALAGYQLAQESALPVYYLETEAKRTFLYQYVFDKPLALPKLEGPIELPALITIHDYLMAFLKGYAKKGFSEKDGGVFEKAVFDALSGKVDERKVGIKPQKAGSQIDIDLLVRIKNQVAVIEIKDKDPRDEPKKGIDQLNTIGGREYLGIYTYKILVSSTKYKPEIHELASSRNIKIIELTSFRTTKKISPQDKQLLIEEITTLLTPQQKNSPHAS